MSLSTVAYQFFKLTTPITNELGEPWQITEVTKLITDNSLLKSALDILGGKEPSARDWIKNSFFEENKQDKYLSTMAVISALGALEPLSIKARIGYYCPAWTPKEAIEKGLLVICDGARLINQPRV